MIEKYILIGLLVVIGLSVVGYLTAGYTRLDNPKCTGIDFTKLYYDDIEPYKINSELLAVEADWIYGLINIDNEWVSE